MSALEYFFFNLRGQKDFHNFTGEGLFLGQVCILNDLLGDGVLPSLGDLSPVPLPEPDRRGRWQSSQRLYEIL